MIDYNKPIKEVKQIAKTYTTIVRVDDLEEIIEEPCLEACKDFYEKNLITIQSSANSGETTAWIIVDITTMSDENKAIVENLLGEEEKSETMINNRKVEFCISKSNFVINVPMIEKDTVGSVSEILTNISNRFKYQDILAHRTTFENLVMNLYYNTEDDTFREQLKTKIDLYDISYAESYNVDPESLCHTYNQALEFYSKCDPENGRTFVDSMIDCINEFPEDIGGCDKEDGLFYSAKSHLNRHLDWKNAQTSKK